MSKLLANILKVSPLLLSAVFLVASRAQASQSPAPSSNVDREAATVASSPGESSSKLSQGLVANNTLSQLVSPETSSSLRPTNSTEVGTAETLIKTPSVLPLTASQVKPTQQIANQTLAQSTPATETATPNSAAGVLEQINRYSEDSPSDSIDQVTNVSQLRDVSPGDWAYEALRSLVERYGCIAGYPDGTFRGNRAMTRYEFAAGLNACLNQIERLIQGGSQVSREDFDALQRMVQEFQTELTTLGTRVDNLEGRVGFLEDHQFSTTTKLNAAVIFGLAGVASGQNAAGGDINKSTILGDRVRLNFDTSFTGKDLLRTRLQALNINAFSNNSTLTPEGDLRFGAGPYETGDNNVEIDALLYQFPIGKKGTVVLEANAGAPDDFTNTVNPYIDGDGDSGALSNFGTRNPIYDLVGGAGLGLNYAFSDKVELSLGYLASDAANPSQGSGLFQGPYGGIAQLTVKPTDKITLGLTYVNSYNSDLTAGSNRANLRSALVSDNGVLPSAILDALRGTDLPISSNSYGLEASWKISPKLVLGGWAGYTNTRILSTLGGAIDRGDLSIWNWAVTLAVPDLGKEGNVAGIVVGMEPKVTDVSNSLKDEIGEDKDTSLHIEAFYQYQVTDNIAITPGIIWLTAPDHNNDNDDVVIGAIRTTFTF